MPATPAVVVGRTGAPLGELARVEAIAGKCLYLVRRADGVLWAVDASTSRLKR
jgi:hypothetical protein